MKKQHHVIERSRQCLASLGNIQPRTQFGGYALTVEKVVFALVSEDGLYLRASEALREYVSNRPLEPLVFRKRGTAVSLNYFKVDHALWEDENRLISLSAAALHTAREEFNNRQRSSRLKDLPNLSLRLELLLLEAGISTIGDLIELGAKQSWLKLRAINQHVGFNTLLALEGAIKGRHQAALPQQVKAELDEWYKNALRQELNKGMIR